MFIGIRQTACNSPSSMMSFCYYRRIPSRRISTPVSASTMRKPMPVPCPPTPQNESRRQMLVDDRPFLLDHSADPFLDEIVKIAAAYFKAPVSLVSIVDNNRQWFRAKIGTALQETPRCISFCAYSVVSGEGLEVCDATLDDRFSSNPLVIGEPGIRYYAGAPLEIEDGVVLGNLCIIDTKARQPMLADDAIFLRQLANLVVSRIRDLRISAFIDAPTGLFNRVKLEDDIDETLKKGDALLAVAIEVVSPAQMNDMLKSLGFHFLDDFIRSVGNALRTLLPTEWALYKISALRFAFIVPQSLIHQAESVFSRLVDAFSKPMDCQGIPIMPQIGIGILRMSAGTVASDWMRLIVSAADEARTSGRGWAYYDSRMDEAQQRATRLLNDLSNAIHSPTQLRLVYQPRVDLSTGACVSAEALLRWTHPTLGEISPAEFIPLAEKTALILAVSFWVVKRAIEQAANWRSNGIDLKVAINVSAADLSSGHLTDEIIRLLDQHGLAGSSLEVEFTESALIGDSSTVLIQIERLKAIGIDIAIDDFGSGYSNWSYLRDIPASIVKLDRSFMNDLRHGQRDWSITRALIALARELGMRVVAEGIETSRTLDLIRECGCQEAQGFFISRPLEPSALIDWLRNEGKA
ncbi:sensor domain-containing phosphodiesterase [Pseudomonas dryadis]|uniref:Sensor domain-containing phosphodiesterase n=2 Tax=Pseudomonadales TaxID=72274 RepID=A0ABY1Z3S4_9GAMM|nr:sensor domain-containing phosphodiesterase [Pseudomonas dryadis]TBV16568.1 sensor domain-containing phosphodiesterase [Pseudomonas sp. FRB 230]